MPDLLTGFGLIALVLTISALASGLVDRAPLSFPIIFLGLGFALGERGLGVIQIGVRDPVLEAIATLSLALVLFLDATKVRIEEVSRDWLIPVLALGPGTLLTIGIVAAGSMLLLPVGPIPALLVGAVLSSTDPVVLRDVLRDDRLPRSIRRALSIEAGTNDLVVLPALLVLIAVLTARAGSAGDWAVFVFQVFILGPAVGFVIGGAGSWLMGRVDARFEIRREFQALYGIGLVLASFAAGLAVGGDGFLAAFAGGAAVAILNHELCDCFLDYGEVTSEMAMLLAFILFGAALSVSISTVPLLPALALAVIVIVVARPIAMYFVLRHARVSPIARIFIGWFGPRGLSSLLLALLAVQRHVPDAEGLFADVGVVVLVSVVVHGVTATPFSAWYARRVAREVLEEERSATAAGLFESETAEAPRITPQELARELTGPNPPVVLDVRTRSSLALDPARIPGAVQVLPDRIVDWAQAQPPNRPIVAYCT